MLSTYCMGNIHRQLVINDDKFVGINLGMNSTNNNHNISKLINLTTKINDYTQLNVIDCNGVVLDAKKDKLTIKDWDRWKNTPFAYRVLNRYTNYFIKPVIIRDSHGLLDNDKYTFIYIGLDDMKSLWEKKFGKRRLFSDLELISNEIDNEKWKGFSHGINVKNLKLNNFNVIYDSYFVGFWGTNLNGFALFIKSEEFANQIIESLKNGNLAVVGREERLFGGYTGLCLIDLYEAYFGKRG